MAQPLIASSKENCAFKTELSQIINQATFLQSDIKQALHAHVEASIASTNG